MSTSLSSNTTNHLSSDEAIHDLISPSLDKNELVLRTTFDNCYDIAFRRVQIFGQFDILLVYLDGLVDTQALDQILLKPWMLETPRPGLGWTAC